jgi:hypothetical protein
MRRSATVVVVAIAVTISAAAATAGRPVGVVGRIPTLGTGQTWQATLRAPRTPVVVARRGPRSLSFRTTRIARHRYRAAIRIATPGRWTLSARLGAKRYPLGSIRVVARLYRLEVPAQLLANPDGSLLVAERGLRNRITRIDPGTGRVSLFSTVPAEPYGLAWQGQRLLVSTRAGIYTLPAHGGRSRPLDAAQVGPLVPDSDTTAFYGEETELGRIDLASGAKHPFPTTVANPHTLLLIDPGRLLVADSGNRRILSVNTASGAATTIASGLTTPLGMTFGEAGDLIVGEHDTGRLIRVRPDGSKSVLAGGLSKPYSVVRALDGNYYVAEVGELAFPSGALRRVSPAGRVSIVRLRT